MMEGTGVACTLGIYCRWCRGQYRGVSTVLGAVLHSSSSSYCTQNEAAHKLWGCFLLGDLGCRRVRQRSYTYRQPFKEVDHRSIDELSRRAL